MAILDSKGRLFGKVSILDVGAALVILFVMIGIFFFPGSTGSVAQVGVKTQPVEIDLIVRGLSIRDPNALVEDLMETKKSKVIIRNQPYGQVDVKSVQLLDRSVLVPQPDGSVKALPDPRKNERFATDMLMTIGGKAQITEDGVVLGSSKLRIGNTIELEGKTYNFNSSVIDIRLQK